MEQRHSITSSRIEVRPVDPREWWPYAERFLRKACESNSWLGDLSGLREEVFKGKTSLICLYRSGRIEGFATAAIVNTSQGNVMEYQALAARTKEVFQSEEIMDAANRLAKFNRCDRIAAGCRPGVAKLLRSKGWRPVVTIMEKRVDG